MYAIYLSLEYLHIVWHVYYRSHVDRKLTSGTKCFLSVQHLFNNKDDQSCVFNIGSFWFILELASYKMHIVSFHSVYSSNLRSLLHLLSVYIYNLFCLFILLQGAPGEPGLSIIGPRGPPVSSSHSLLLSHLFFNNIILHHRGLLTTVITKMSVTHVWRNVVGSKSIRSQEGLEHSQHYNSEQLISDRHYLDQNNNIHPVQLFWVMTRNEFFQIYCSWQKVFWIPPFYTKTC